MYYNSREIEDIVKFIEFEFSNLGINFNELWKKEEKEEYEFGSEYYEEYILFKEANKNSICIQVNLTIVFDGTIKVLMIDHNIEYFILEFEANYRDITFYNIIKNFIDKYFK